jgi:hypothetical protein
LEAKYSAYTCLLGLACRGSTTSVRPLQEFPWSKKKMEKNSFNNLQQKKVKFPCNKKKTTTTVNPLQKSPSKKDKI